MSKNGLQDDLLSKDSPTRGKPLQFGENKISCDGPYPYEKKMKTKVYEKTLVNLQIELNKLQDWVQKTGQKIVIVFEGRDAAGKGGTIKRFREHLNPRCARIVAEGIFSGRTHKDYIAVNRHR